MHTIWQYFVSWDLCEYLVTRCSSKILWIVLILCPDFICWFWYIYTKIYTSKYLKIRISICPNIQCITNISKPKYFYFFVNNILDYFDTENYTWRLVIVKIFMNFNNFSCLTVWAKNVWIPYMKMFQWAKCFNTPIFYATLWEIFYFMLNQQSS